MEYRYVIEYQYKSRIWGTQSYNVPADDNDEAFTVEEFNKYIQTAQVTDAATKQTVDGIEFRSDALKKEFLTSKAPYEDNFRETITWNFTGATVSYYDSGKQLSIKVTTTSAEDEPLYLVVHFPFECNVQTTGLHVTRDGEDKVIIHWSDRQQNMRVGIVTVGIVNGDVGAHSVINKIFLNIIRQQFYPLRFVKLNRQGNDQFACESAVLRFLGSFNRVPQNAPAFPFRRRVSR